MIKSGIKPETIKHKHTTKIIRACDDCGKEEEVLVASVVFSSIRKRTGKDLCRKCSYKYRNHSRNDRGAKSANWKGGVGLSYSGYLRFSSKWDENGEKRDKRGEYVHKIIYGDYIGRKLEKREQLHHIDMNKINNNISNLFYCENKSVHHIVHAQMEEVGLYVFGKKIWFDKVAKEYVLDKKTYPKINFVSDKMPTYRELWKNGKYYDFVYMGHKKHRLYHRYIMDKYTGKEIKKGTQVHHIDGDTLNNDINNLAILSRSEHRNAHNSLQRCVAELYKNGIVGFDNGKYFLKEN